ncbi:MAG TPA: hypothetical protein PLP19_14245 [bacterium]|nr:hypothetical protein [bacterium]HPN44650.1 hypothetical protein [bacterium]
MISNRENRFSLLFLWILCLSLPVCFLQAAYGQAECAAWGNLAGIRIDGQLMEFETSLCLVNADWTQFTHTAKEQQRPFYRRDGNNQIITTKLDAISFIETVTDSLPGQAVITIQATSAKDTILAGVFLCVDLPGNDYSGATVELVGAAASARNKFKLKPAKKNGQNEYVHTTAGGVRIEAKKRQLEISFNEPTEIIIRNDRQRSNSTIRVYLAIISSELKNEQKAAKTFTFNAGGEIDRSPAEIIVDINKPGRPFDGIGGNFRIQNPQLDPLVIEYCLDNLNVTWGRVELPWGIWQPQENEDPIAAADAGMLNERVRQAMEMAQKLSKLNMPVIVSAWFPPQWAVLGEMRRRGPQPGGLRGNPLNPDKMTAICKSLGDYLVYLKEHYNTEAVMFSFNESDLGINVRQTGEEHAALIKTLGAHLKARGLSTKMLLGDNSDATTFTFIDPAMNDPETHPYIGAVSFHSWRGCTDEILTIWANAAKKLNVPLLVGEGSTDAAAHSYPDIFTEPSFSLAEIDLYIRICAISQPISILQWQLTSDYSVLTGGGIFRKPGPMLPTQRFWNLKQLGATSKGSLSLPVKCTQPLIHCAAFGIAANNDYAVHLINNGAERNVTLKGLPKDIQELYIYVTNAKKNMQNEGTIQVVNGKARFNLESSSYTTCFTSKKQD